MKKSIRSRPIGFRLGATICTAILLIAVFSFLSVPTHADSIVEKAIKEAADAVKEADEAYEKESKAWVPDDAGEEKTDQDKKAEDAAQAADAAAAKADAAQDSAQQKQQEADDAAKAAKNAKDKKAAQEKQNDADKAKTDAQTAEDEAAAKEKASDDADTAANKADNGKKAAARKLRKLKRARGRARNKARRKIEKARKLLEEKAGSSEAEKLRKALDDVETRIHRIPLPDFNVIPPSAGQASVITKSSDGMRVINFETSAGRIKVNLPDDMMAGDTISGTVIAEPKGGTDQERTKNSAELNGYVIELNFPKPRNEGDKKLPPNVIVIMDSAKSNGFKITLPDTKTSQKLLDVNLRQLAPGERSKFSAPNYYPLRENETAPGRLIATPSLDAYMEVPFPAINDFNIPKIVQQGRPIEITGPFDGDFSNTTLKSSVQDFEKNTENASGGFGLLTESPHRAVFSNSENATGPIQITLNEGNKQTTGTYRNVGVNLTAPRTSLLKGEKTELRVEVSGLQGIKEPIPLTLESRGVITTEGGTYQPLVIQPSQVSSDGRYSTTRGITGVQAGGWSATATVVTHSFDVMLESENCIRHLRLNSSTGDYTFNCPGCSYMMSDGTLMTTEQFAVFSLAPIGRGIVKQKGCTLTLEDNAPDRRVMATIDQCAKTGTATIDVPANKAKFTITDRNTTDSTCAVP